MEFMLDTMTLYSNFSFAKRRNRYEGLTKLVEEAAPEKPPVSKNKLKNNKTYERIMNEPIQKK